MPLKPLLEAPLAEKTSGCSRAEAGAAEGAEGGVLEALGSPTEEPQTKALCAAASVLTHLTPEVRGGAGRNRRSVPFGQSMRASCVEE